MFRKMLILGFICFLSLAFLGKAGADNWISARALEEQEPHNPISGVHVYIYDFAGYPVADGLTDAQGYFWFNVIMDCGMLRADKECYTLANDPDHDGTIGFCPPGAFLMTYTCPLPQHTIITVKDAWTQALIEGAHVALNPAQECPNSCNTDANGQVSFDTVGQVQFTATKTGYQDYNGTAPAGHNTQAPLQPSSGGPTTWLTALDGRSMTLLTGSKFTIKDYNTLATLYEFTYPSCDPAVGPWDFADSGATFKFYIPGRASYTVQHAGFIAQTSDALMPNEHRNVILNIPTNYIQGGEGCFLAGTPILMADKSAKPIEKVMPGDKILSYDEKAKTTMKEKVRVFMMQESDGYVLINGRIKATGDHPFYVEGKWIFARDLKAGDQLLGIDGKPEAVKSIKIFNKKVLVYNFEAVPSHTYFAAGVLVHNRPGKVQSWQDEPIEY